MISLIYLCQLLSNTETIKFIQHQMLIHLIFRGQLELLHSCIISGKCADGDDNIYIYHHVRVCL